jgi:ribonuclease H / adenosylcobalamin/alpha-ribazole phosphatase
MKLYTDGSKTRVAYVLETDNGIEITSGIIPYKAKEMTTNQMEYYALLAGLYLIIKDFDLCHVDIYADSQLMVRQIEGTYKVKSKTLTKLHKAAMIILKSSIMFDNDYTINWLPRESNKAGILLEDS